MAKFFMFPNPCLNIVLGLSGRYRDTVMYSVECTLQFHTCDMCHVRISHYYYKNPTFPGPSWSTCTVPTCGKILPCISHGSQGSLARNHSQLSVGLFPPSKYRLFGRFSHRIWTIHSIAWNLHKHIDIYLSICIYLALLHTNSAHFVLVNKMGCSIY